MRSDDSFGGRLASTTAAAWHLDLLLLAGVVRAEECRWTGSIRRGTPATSSRSRSRPTERRWSRPGADGLAKLWDVAAGSVRADLAGHEGKVLCLASRPTARRSRPAARTVKIRLWAMADGASLGALSGHTGAVTPGVRTRRQDARLGQPGHHDPALGRRRAKRRLTDARGARGGGPGPGLRPRRQGPRLGEPRHVGQALGRRRRARSRGPWVGTTAGPGASPSPPTARPWPRAVSTRWCGSGGSTSPPQRRSGQQQQPQQPVRSSNRSSKPRSGGAGRRRRAGDRLLPDGKTLAAAESDPRATRPVSRYRS